MQESLRKYEIEKNEKNILKWEILEYLAFSLFKEGRCLYNNLTLVMIVVGTSIFIRYARNTSTSFLSHIW